MIQHPSIVEDLFSLCRRYLKLVKHIFFKCNQLEEMMGVAVKAVGLDHSESADSHSKFLVDLLSVIRYDIKRGLKLQSVPHIATA